MPLKTATMRFSNARNSQRLSVAIPVRIAGKDIQGKSFTEETRTSEVNRTGARVSLAHELEAESKVQVTLVGGKRVNEARVVWSRPAENGGYWDTGLDLKDGVDFWGIQFPGDDWKPKTERPGEAVPVGQVEPAGPPRRRRSCASRRRRSRANRRRRSCASRCPRPRPPEARSTPSWRPRPRAVRPYRQRTSPIC